jgi:hypothetical protein
MRQWEKYVADAIALGREGCTLSTNPGAPGQSRRRIGICSSPCCAYCAFSMYLIPGSLLDVSLESLLRQEHQVPLAEAPSTEPFRLSSLSYVFSSERHKYSASSYSCIRSYLKLLAHTRNQHPTSLTPDIINRHLAIFLCLSPLATLLDEDFTAPAFGVITTYMCQVRRALRMSREILLHRP